MPETTTQILVMKAPKIGSVQYVAQDRDPSNPTSGLYLNRTAIQLMTGKNDEPRRIEITVKVLAD